MTTMRVGEMVEGDVGADALARRLRAGEQAALAEFYDLHGTRIYNYCFRRTASWSDAEDLTSEVFLAAWRSRERVVTRDEGLLPWLYAIAGNVLRNHARSERRSRALLVGLPKPGDEPGADRVLERLGDEQRVRRALDRLAQFPVDHQEVFWLVVWEGLGYEQAALALNCPVGTVRSRLSRVRQALRLTDEACHE